MTSVANSQYLKVHTLWRVRISKKHDVPHSNLDKWLEHSSELSMVEDKSAAHTEGEGAEHPLRLFFPSLSPAA